MCQIWIQLVTACSENWKRRCTKYASLIWTNWNSDWEQSGSSWIMSSLQQPFVGGVVDSSRSVISVLYTFYCNISRMRLSAGLKSGEVGGHSWGGINSEVSCCNNLLVARVQWASQVSEVETLFRWGGKRLHHFASNLLRKRCIDFHQNRRVLWEMLQKHFGFVFFLDTV